MKIQSSLQAMAKNLQPKLRFIRAKQAVGSIPNRIILLVSKTHREAIKDLKEIYPGQVEAGNSVKRSFQQVVGTFVSAVPMSEKRLKMPENLTWVRQKEEQIRNFMDKYPNFSKLSGNTLTAWQEHENRMKDLDQQNSSEQ